MVVAVHIISAALSQRDRIEGERAIAVNISLLSRDVISDKKS
jgi:hypothetical protein